MTPPASPFFSVVIPTHNRAGLLAQALDSVWAQRFHDFEVIVVDDGSSDDTATVLARREPRLQVCRQERGGPGPARNLGAHHARGAYLAFLDSDDVWLPWALEVYARAIAQTGSPAFLAGTPAYFSSPQELEQVEETPPALETFRDYYMSEEAWRWWGASAFVIRRDVFEAVGGFTREWINGEDADLLMRLGTSDGFVHVSAPSTFGYRTHGDSAMANFDRTIAGAWYMVEAERAGRYPGGGARATTRRRILGRHLRSVMLSALGRGRRRDAWRMYRATFRWHLGLGRWRFLLAFPFMAARTATRA